ncbi:MAG TPA: DUF3168 domain-containing protein [Steroidobacteraceae bacterium]
MELEDVRDALVEFQPVTALVAGSIYYLQVPENSAAPYIVLKRISTEPQRSLTGSTGEEPTQFIVECWAPTYTAVIRLRDAARAALEQAGLQMQLEAEEYDSVVRLHSVVQHWILWD